jgi:hypothetical protein
MTKSRGRGAKVANTGKFQGLITAAIEGRDDEMAQRARQVAAGKVDPRTMTFHEVFVFVEPADLYEETDADRLRRMAGSVTYDQEFAEQWRARSLWRHARSQALLEALMLTVDCGILDLWLTPPWAVVTVLNGPGQADGTR